jgi:hypothetical protein
MFFHERSETVLCVPSTSTWRPKCRYSRLNQSCIRAWCLLVRYSYAMPRRPVLSTCHSTELSTDICHLYRHATFFLSSLSLATQKSQIWFCFLFFVFVFFFFFLNFFFSLSVCVSMMSNDESEAIFSHARIDLACGWYSPRVCFTHVSRSLSSVVTICARIWPCLSSTRFVLRPCCRFCCARFPMYHINRG